MAVYLRLGHPQIKRRTKSRRQMDRTQVVIACALSFTDVGVNCTKSRYPDCYVVACP